MHPQVAARAKLQARHPKWARRERLMTFNWNYFPAGDFDVHADVWQEINLAGPASPLLSPRFITPLIENFSTGAELIAVCSKSGTPVAMAILQKIGFGTWQTFQPVQAPVGLLVKRSSINIRELLHSLLSSIPGLPLVVGIARQDADQVPRPADSGRISTLDAVHAARVLINRPFDEYWQACDGKLRQEADRRLASVRAMGIEPRLELFTDAATVAFEIENYGRLESADGKSTEGTAVHADNVQRRFYTSLLQSFCRLGKGRIYRYSFGDSVAAMQLCIEMGRTLVFLKTAYDDTLRSHDPGILMQYEIMRQVIAEGTVDKVEFYGKNGEPQAMWCGHQIRTMYHVYCYRSPLLSKIRHFLLRRSPESSANATSPSPAAATSPATAVPARQTARKWRLVPASEFGNHVQDWQAVLSTLPYTPVLDPIFIKTLLDVFSQGNELLAICYEGQSPTAIAVLRKTGILGWQTMQPSQAPLGLWLHRPGLTWEELLPEMQAQLPGLPMVLRIVQMNVENFKRPKDQGRIRTLDVLETARIWTNRPYSEFWNARKSSLRHQIEGGHRRLRDEGITPHLEAVTDPAGIHAAVEEFGRIESVGWTGARGTAVHIDNVEGRFYSGLLREFSAHGHATVYRYRFNDATVAMEICIDGGGTLVMLKTTHDETYKEYAPGMLMRHAIFARVFAEERIESIEFLGNIQPWQANWVDETYSLYHITCYRWYWLAGFIDVLSALRLQTGLTARLKNGGPVGCTEAVGERYIVTKYSEFSALPVRYEELFAHGGKASFFHTREWYENFIRSVLTPNQRPRFYTVETASMQPAARALLPMLGQERGSGVFSPRTLTGVSNYYTSLFGPVIMPGGFGLQNTLDALAAAIIDDEIRWDVIELHPLDTDAPVFSGLVAALRKAGCLVHTYFCFGNWYLQVRGRSYAEYFATLPSKVKSTITRKKIQFEKHANSKIIVYQDEAGLEEGLRAYEQIYAASWKVPEPYPQFISGLCRTCAKAGWLRLAVAYVDDQPAAAQLWIVIHGTANIYKLAYDERYARFSLGTILSAHLMERAIDIDKVHEVDYLTGDDAYKKDWMSDRRERWGIVAFNLRTPRGALAATSRLGTRVAKRAIDAARLRIGKVLRGAVWLGTVARWNSARGFFGQTIHELGWLNGCLYALDRLLASISSERVRLHKYYFVAQPVSDKRWLPPKRGASIEIRRVTESDPIITESPRPYWAAPYRFKQGAFCLAGLKEGKCIGFLWLTLSPYQEDEVRCRYIPLPPGKSSWDFDIYVQPQHRNGIAFLKLWDEANSFLAERGVKWTLSRISAFNMESMLAHAKLKAHRIGAVTFLSIGPCQISAATVFPYFHVSTHADSFPVFLLNPEPARAGEPVA